MTLAKVQDFQGIHIPSGCWSRDVYIWKWGIEHAE
jgi:hypothetical protein